MKWLLYRTYPNLVLDDWIRAKKEVENVDNWSRTNIYPYINKEVTIPTQKEKVFAEKQLALAIDLYGNLKRTPSHPPPPLRDYRRDYSEINDFRLTF